MAGVAQPVPLAEDEVLKPRQVAELLGVHYHTVLARIADGELRAVRRGTRLYVRRSWVEEFLNADEAKAAS